MITHLLERLPDATRAALTPVAVFLFLAVLVYLLVQGFHESVVPKGLNYPIIDPKDYATVGDAIKAGVKKYHPTTPFTLYPIDNGHTLILPMSLFSEVHSIPTSIYSLMADTYERFAGRYTHLADDQEEVIDAIRMDLTRGIAGNLGVIQKEAAWSLRRELDSVALSKENGQQGEWEKVPVYFKLLRIVSIISGRLFVGLPLSRTDEWMDMSIGYTVNVVRAGDDGWKWHPALRPLVYPFMQSIRNVQEQQRKMREWMKPLAREVRDRIAGLADDGGGVGWEKRNGKVGDEVGEETRGNFITWLWHRLSPERRTDEMLMRGQMAISFAAIHTTSSTSAMALFDLAGRQDLIKQLREEMDEVAREDGLVEDPEAGIVVFPKSSMVKLQKLDSFLKESQRMSPLAWVTATKKMTQSYTLSNGIFLPKGARIAFPAWAVHTSPETKTFSPSYNASTTSPNAPPDVFDPLRFYRLRQVPGREHRHQLVTTGTDSLSFGHGPHACPGRFFAAYEIKAVVMALLQRYDVRLEGGGEAEHRPQSVDTGGIGLRPPMGCLELRKRTKS